MEEVKSNIPLKKTSPRDRANVMSTLFFCWLLPYFVKGYKRELTEDDMYQNRKQHESSALGDNLERRWNEHIAKNKNPSYVKVLMGTFISEIIILNVFAFITEAIKMGQPFLISQLLLVYETTGTDEGKNDIYFYAGLIVITSFLNVILVHRFNLAMMQVGMKMRISSCSLIYRKSLKLSKSALAETTIGQMVNLLSNDVGRFDQAVHHLHHFYMAPLETLIVMVLLYYNVGWTALFGAVFLLLSIPFQSWLGKKTSQYRLQTALRTDERVRLMNEIISGIQVIKMYTWEYPFAKLVESVRLKEMKYIRSTSVIRAILMSMDLILNRAAVAICIITYALTQDALTASYAYAVTSYYRLLGSLTFFFPQAVSQGSEMYISMKRIQKFLLFDEIHGEDKAVPKNWSNGNYKPNFELQSKVSGVNVQIKNGSAKWLKSRPENNLEDIDFNVNAGKVVAVVGAVGSGKTTLLHVIMKELELESGSIAVHGTISYASQEPWLFGGSIRQNILFGQEFDQQKYDEVVRVCALQRDFTLFPHGDRTLAGERGVTLSGGQRARINLARAVYKDADIYLLDDPLSAVDTHVADLEEEEEEVRRKSRMIANKEDKPEEEELQTLRREDKGIGTISARVYLKYAKAGGNIIKVFLLLLAFCLTQILEIATEYFVTFWVNIQQWITENLLSSTEPLEVSNITNFSELPPTSNSDNPFNWWLTPVFTSTNTATYYAIVNIMAIVVVLIRSLFFYSWCLTASTRLHNKMFVNIVYSPMRFFNINPSGRILNRFSKDIGSLDEVLPMTLLDTVQIGLSVAGIGLVISSLSYWIMIPTITIAVIFYVLRVIFLETSRDVKRVESITRSPIYTHLSASLQGLTTIRAFKAEEILKTEFDRYQNLHSAAFFMYLGANRTFGFWLDFICVIYIALVIVALLFIKSEQFAGNMGLALTQAMTLTGTFQWGMRQWSELENQMTSVERVQEYADLKQEEEEEEQMKKPQKNWPEEGKVEFIDMSLHYSRDDPPVLKNLSFKIQPTEKVGIVGRTGAGKSSLIQALFRLAEIDGQILIDDVDAKSISLKDLRSNISIIPQEPVLFSGTLRNNLDPFDEYKDEVLWNALEEVELKRAVDELPAGLDSKMAEGGSNFSVGQRQLVCLARAIIRNNKVLVLDEATANVDPYTDGLIQTTIRKKFDNCTVLTIAHRLHTIMDSDKVLVMDAGRVAEFDHPHTLLQNENGIFYSLVMQTGKTTAKNLMEIAKESKIMKDKQT
ncbi:probable multidrug resistance-associated protein lethal(2)03659 isoform X2 [Diorhabda sublineata]|uniref:probable multidrug resistance-associated protein lethal(2)03659 isoform X2 n=1 Tax=Diorhabda sublineata TaxID=1163346 RepID=UPI0024E11F7B|nr:probable multidrug resistance-associated protein lethal(2)03659 isoform X2 [Diorhabda sublineata]